MTENNLSDNMNVVVIIDKEKLPEDIRRMIEQSLPKDVQDKVFEMLQKGKMDNIIPLQRDKPPDNESVNNKLFAIQTGTVVGNIYTDGTYKKEEELSIKKKRDKINESLDGCC